MSDNAIAGTPDPPYIAVIFTSRRAAEDRGYAATAEEMERLARLQPGFLGVETARGADGVGITVSYWASVADARAWKRVARHVEVQRRGRAEWYDAYRVRIATVEREYGHERAESAAREPMTEAAPIRPEH